MLGAQVRRQIRSEEQAPADGAAKAERFPFVSSSLLLNLAQGCRASPLGLIRSGCKPKYRRLLHPRERRADEHADCGAVSVRGDREDGEDGGPVPDELSPCLTFTADDRCSPEEFRAVMGR